MPCFEREKCTVPISRAFGFNTLPSLDAPIGELGLNGIAKVWRQDCLASSRVTRRDCSMFCLSGRGSDSPTSQPDFNTLVGDRLGTNITSRLGFKPPSNLDRSNTGWCAEFYVQFARFEPVVGKHSPKRNQSFDWLRFLTPSRLGQRNQS